MLSGETPPSVGLSPGNCWEHLEGVVEHSACGTSILSCVGRGLQCICRWMGSPGRPSLCALGPGRSDTPGDAVQYGASSVSARTAATPREGDLHPRFQQAASDVQFMPHPSTALYSKYM